MNLGERGEILMQLRLIELRDSGQTKNVKSVGFINGEFKSLPNKINLNQLSNQSDSDLEEVANFVGISKAPTNFKADTIINGKNFSLKSLSSAPPALVNHTTRPGFEFAADNSGFDIAKLDKLVDLYWERRLSGVIKEDISNSNDKSPFRDQLQELRPLLNFFLFKGSGSSISKLPADFILGYQDPLNDKTWKWYSEEDALDHYWDKLVFSLRAKKGMPSGYPFHLSPKMCKKKDSIDRWTKHISGDYRGALHIRSKS